MKFKTIAAGAGLAVAASMLSVAPAQAADVTVREGDLNCSETRATGHNDVGPSDVHVWTEGNTSTDKAACYYTLPPAFPTSASMLWADNDNEPGTARPGQQLVFDYDNIAGNGNDFNILVGEPVYGDNWWLTNGSSADAKAADPSGTENGGNGSEWFGTLAQWQAAMPNATVSAGGWSLGSGVLGNGWVKSQTYGGDTYTFTNEEEPPVVTEDDVDGTHFASRPRTRQIRITMVSEDKPANTTMGDRLRWRITVNGNTRYTGTQGYSDTDVWTSTRFAYARNGAAKTVRVYKNNVLDRTYTVSVRQR